MKGCSKLAQVKQCTFRINSVEDYLSAIDQIFSLLCTSTPQGRCELWFRGMAQAGFQLLPTIARSPWNPLMETAFLSRFKSLAIPFVQDLPAFPLPGGLTSYWSWLFLMRHYGVPTRLLDWSRDALTALFFATDPTDPSLQEGTDAVVWVLNPVTLNKAFSFHSYFKPGYIPNVEEPTFNLFFGPDSDILSSKKPAAAIGPLNSPRIVAQRGTFTVFPRVQDLIPLENFEDASDYLIKICVAWEAFNVIQTQLQHYGITRITLFPEIQSIAEEVIQQVLQEDVETTEID